MRYSLRKGVLKRRAKANLSGQEKIGLEAWEFWGKRDAEALRQSNLLKERGSYGRYFSYSSRVAAKAERTPVRLWRLGRVKRRLSGKLIKPRQAIGGMGILGVMGIMGICSKAPEWHQNYGKRA